MKEASFSTLALHRPRTAFGALLLGCALIVGGCAKKNAPKPPPAVPVTAQGAVKKNVEVTVVGLGTVTPLLSATIASRVAGVLTEVKFTEGQMVKKGDLLAVVDPRPYEAALEQAQGQLARDQALLKNAHLDVERYRKAFQEHAIPEQQVATQEASVEGDEGVVKIDKGNLASAQVNVDYTHITAPIDGRAGLRLVDVGNIVQANGTNGIVTITQMKPITVVFTLPQDNLPEIIKSMQSGTALAMQVLDRGQQNAIAQGKLLTIDNQVEAATGTIRLKGEFANDDGILWPGEFVNVRLVTSVTEGAVTVPARAIQNGPNGTYLFVVKPDMTVDLRKVDVGRTDRGDTVITKGLAENEQVVVDGQFRLEQGTKVALRKPDAPATTSNAPAPASGS